MQEEIKQIFKNTLLVMLVTDSVKKKIFEKIADGLCWDR